MTALAIAEQDLSPGSGVFGQETGRENYLRH
jgi:hypothetical protein